MQHLKFALCLFWFVSALCMKDREACALMKAGPVDYVAVEESLKCLHEFYNHIFIRIAQIEQNCESFKCAAKSDTIIAATGYGFHVLYKIMFHTTSQSLSQKVLLNLAELKKSDDTLTIKSIRDNEDRKKISSKITEQIKQIENLYIKFENTMPAIKRELVYLKGYKKSFLSTETYLEQI